VARLILAAAAALFLPAVCVADAVETVVEVERVEHEKPEHPTLRFLGENRDFFRARLDDLRVRESALRRLQAQGIDPRILDFQRMLEEIRAARDTASAGDERARARALLQSVQDLAALEHEMDRMEKLLDEQEARLARIAEDFVGEQKTTLVVVLTGVPGRGSPKTVILGTEDGDAAHIGLSEPDRLSLAAGGATELLHELVEPRRQTLAISLQGDGWTQAAPWEVVVEPERDRITFLELDLDGVDPADPGADVATRTWTR
jgi:hypothetical protein